MIVSHSSLELRKRGICRQKDLWWRVLCINKIWSAWDWCSFVSERTVASISSFRWVVFVVGGGQPKSAIPKTSPQISRKWSTRLENSLCFSLALKITTGPIRPACFPIWKETGEVDTRPLKGSGKSSKTVKYFTIFQLKGTLAMRSVSVA